MRGLCSVSWSGVTGNHFSTDTNHLFVPISMPYIKTRRKVQDILPGYIHFINHNTYGPCETTTLQALNE